VTEPSATTYADLQRQNAAQTQANTRAIIAAGATRGASLAAVGPLCANVIVAGAAKATALADVGVAGIIAYQIGRACPTAGIALTRERAATIAKGVQTIAEREAPDQLVRLERLALAAPLQAGQISFQDAAEIQGVREWMRQTDADPCPLCKKLADGRPIPIGKRMASHPGCACTMRLLLPDDFEPVSLAPADRVVGHGLGRQVTRQLAPGIQATVPAPSIRRFR
jgi:hypothetical protein